MASTIRIGINVVMGLSDEISGMNCKGKMKSVKYSNRNTTNALPNVRKNSKTLTFVSLA